MNSEHFSIYSLKITRHCYLAVPSPSPSTPPSEFKVCHLKGNCPFLLSCFSSWVTHFYVLISMTVLWNSTTWWPKFTLIPQSSTEYESGWAMTTQEKHLCIFFSAPRPHFWQWPLCLAGVLNTPVVGGHLILLSVPPPYTSLLSSCQGWWNSVFMLNLAEFPGISTTKSL